MNNRDLDRMLRERLENYEVAPPMHVWDNIAKARASARRPVSPWVWWGSGLGVLAFSSSIVLWLMLGQTSWTPPASLEIPSEEPAIPKNEAAEIIACEEAFLAPIALPIALSGEEKASVFAAAEEAQEEVLVEPAAEVVAQEAEEEAISSGHVASFEGLTSAGLGWIDWMDRPRDGFPEKTCNAFTKEKWKMNWHIEAVASPDYAFRSLTPQSPEFSDYAASRNQSEETRGGFTAGLRISAVTDFGVSLRAGVQYAQINEVFNYRDPNDIRITITNVYDGQGNIIGSDTLYEAGTRLKVTYNRHRMVDIPVMAGYEFQFPRFSMAVHGGVAFNLLFEQRGDILTPEGNPVSVTSGEPGVYPAFRDQLGLSLLGAIGFNYRLTPELQFIVEPQFRIVLDPVSRPGYALNQEYFLTGISLGVRQRL